MQQKDFSYEPRRGRPTIYEYSEVSGQPCQIVLYNERRRKENSAQKTK